MNEPDRASVETLAWYQAVTLKERAASLAAAPRRARQYPVDRGLASRRIGRWRSQAPFTTGSYFEQRLAIDGITDEEFQCLLGEPIEAVRGRVREPPEWLAELARAFSHPRLSDLTGVDGMPANDGVAGFLAAVGPLIDQARARAHDGVEALLATSSDVPFDPGTAEELLYTSLRQRLGRMLSRTMALELNVARLQRLLSGDSPEERFRSFLRRISQRENALALLQEYPVLARQLVITTNNWCEASLEFLCRLKDDWELIQASFSPEQDPGPLVDIDSEAGESHRGGRTVLIPTFDSGFRLVYKPRPLAVDVHFQELLRWVNARGGDPPFRTLKILDRGTYGWEEFVPAESCGSPPEARRFYERQGGYLALLYALEATDFHRENLIAAGEHPVLLDLEALFHPRVRGIDPEQADGAASGRIGRSVLRVGLLPRRSWANAESAGADISGLGGEPDQLTPRPLPYWDAAGTDEMRLQRKRVAIGAYQNRPALNGVEPNASDYADAIVAGFTRMYRLLQSHRDDLLSEDGPLARFALDEVRVVVRGTESYATVLQESFHPDVLRDALDRDRLFDRLWAAVEQYPSLASVIPAEREDLWKADIPIFTTRPDSRDLWSSSGQRTTDFFDEPGMALVRRRLLGLSEEDLDLQLRIARMSLATLSVGAEGARRPNCRPIEPRSGADRGRLLATAQAVADRLEAIALRDELHVSWIGLKLTRERYWSLAPLGIDLYDGLPGVALFLAYLGAITREERYTALAQKALTTLRRQVERERSSITSIGGFTGWGGVLYALVNLAVLLDLPVLLGEAEGLVELLPPLIDQDDELDVIGGAAGCIAALASLYRCAPSQRTLSTATQCGEHLIARAQTMEPGIGWLTPVSGTRPLAGFSHGAAGIACALLELATMTAEGRFRTAARQAIGYERSLFSVDAGNWRDLRAPEESDGPASDGQDSFMTAWCHGAPGIGLARLRSLEYLDDPAIRAELETAVRTTLDEGFGRNHSLCHGDLGNVELLMQASETIGYPERRELERTTAMILESIEGLGWLCGNPARVESPGLMTGLAGIGYGLLRLAEPSRVPSVLTLDCPVGASAWAAVQSR